MGDNCEHINIVNNECDECGLIFEEDMMEVVPIQQYDEVYTPAVAKKEVFNYYDHLVSIDLPSPIRLDVCDQISRIKEKSHVRINTHIKNLFVMIYIAYSRQDFKFNPFNIGNLLDMSEKDIKSAIKIASDGIDDSGDRNPVCIISPSNFIREIASLFKQDYTITEYQFLKFEELISLLQNNNKMIYNENPKGIAATIIKIFFDVNNIPVKNFLKKIERTQGYIKMQENIIFKTLNSIN